ncbi:MAG: PilZ domain-containing protein [Desulfobacterota bacterium]|nr:PilZ domain-containing protein [Thermodesulfobacteriota bacterium]
MEGLKGVRDRRKAKRRPLHLPLEYQMTQGPSLYGGLTLNASELGLLIQSVKNLSIGTKLNVAVLFPKGFELANFEVLAEIVWKDLHWEEDWKGYKYGLKFLRMQNSDYQKLRELLENHHALEEA